MTFYDLLKLYMKGQVGVKGQNIFNTMHRMVKKTGKTFYKSPKPGMFTFINI